VKRNLQNKWGSTAAQRFHGAQSYERINKDDAFADYFPRKNIPVAQQLTPQEKQKQKQKTKTSA